MSLNQQNLDNVDKNARALFEEVDGRLVPVEGHDHAAIYAPIGHTHGTAPQPPIPPVDPGDPPVEPPPNPGVSGHDRPQITMGFTSTPIPVLSSQMVKDKNTNVPGATYELAAGNHPYEHDTILNGACQLRVAGWTPRTTARAIIDGSLSNAGGKAVFVASRDSNAANADPNAWFVFRGISWKNLKGSASNFSAVRGQKGNLWFEDCDFENAREAVLAQLKDANMTSDDGPNGKTIVFLNCTFKNCGHQGLSHATYTRARHTYHEECVFIRENATASFKMLAHQIKSLSAYTTIRKVKILGKETQRLSALVDISGQGGAVLIEECEFEKGESDTDHFINYRWQRLGNQWAPDYLILNNNNFENHHTRVGAAFPRANLLKNETGVIPVLNGNNFDNKTAAEFRLVREASWNPSNTWSGPCYIANQNGTWMQLT